MRNLIVAASALVLLSIASIGLARDSVEGDQIVIKPYKNDTFETGGYRFGKAELFGYVGDLKDNHKVSGILLRDGAKASNQQKHVIVEIAHAQQLDASIEIDGKREPLVDPVEPASAPAATATPAVASPAQ